MNNHQGLCKRVGGLDGRYGVGGSGDVREGMAPPFRMDLWSSAPVGAGEGAWYPPSHESEKYEYLHPTLLIRTSANFFTSKSCNGEGM